MRELRSHLGRHQPELIDPEAEKPTGWRRHSILVVAEQDPRLSWPERELVRQLAPKPYGHAGLRRVTEPSVLAPRGLKNPQLPTGVPAESQDWLRYHRVELNAMTTPQFIAWLDDKMAALATASWCRRQGCSRET